MSEKYFAKWVPVKGELKEGDDVITITGFLKKYDDFVALEGPTKVKLFLCSRDIQVGEEFKWEDKSLVSLGHGDDDNRYWIHAAYLGKRTAFDVTKAYKVIGEISPEATWVKEEDEFKKSDTERSISGGLFPADKTFDEMWDDKDFPCLGKFYKIKGPCGHFH